MYCIIIKSQDCVCNLGKLLHVYLCVYIIRPFSRCWNLLPLKKTASFILNKLLLCSVIYVRWYSVDACVFVLVTASYPEVVDLIVETLLVIFTKGVCTSTPSWPWHLWGWCPISDSLLTLNAWGTTRPTIRIWLRAYWPSTEFETLQLQRVMM